MPHAIEKTVSIQILIFQRIRCEGACPCIQVEDPNAGNRVRRELWHVPLLTRPSSDSRAKRQNY